MVFAESGVELLKIIRRKHLKKSLVVSQTSLPRRREMKMDTAKNCSPNNHSQGTYIFLKKTKNSFGAVSVVDAIFFSDPIAVL